MALITTVASRHVALSLGQPAPVDFTDEQWELWIADALMFIQDRADKLGVVDIDQAKLDYVIREVVADQVKRRDTDVNAEDFGGYEKFRTVADWYPLLGLSGSAGAYAVDMLPTTTAHLPWCSAMFGAVYCSCGADIAGFPIYENGDAA